MEGVDAILQEYGSLAGKTDATSEARKNEIIAWLKYHTVDVKDDAKAFVNAKLDSIEGDVTTLRSRISDEDYKLLPLSFIAKHYFGKSSAWLSQRLNGTLVRGKTYTLNEEQKRILNEALQDISLRIGALHLD
ncbi:DUF5053 domain-containing protein [Prevotella sp.]|uniref:DUF5053 domain-containing protein n=1 Tax=uncultured Prevotella sp. TaxID=159272 RepID=UPI0027E34BFC|nr:DUF5053 domain-containing protein [uncultured Prevotella sp.]